MNVPSVSPELLEASREATDEDSRRRAPLGDNETIAPNRATDVDLDARVLPTSVELSMTGQPDQTLAAQSRNVAGLVLRRHTAAATAMEFVQSHWTYDSLGRVKTQVVQKGPQLALTQVVRQELAYFGNDDPTSRRLLEGILAVEEEHADDLVSLLEKIG